jgi:hypothetical protein
MCLVFRVLDELMNKKDTLTDQFNKMNQQHVTIKADMSQTNKKRKKTKELFTEEKRKVQQILNSCWLQEA